jgi:hypothetical protein
VSHGPLVTPSTLFGTTVHVKSGQAVQLGFGLESVAGLKQVQLIADGAVAETRAFAEGPLATHTTFEVQAGKARWCALVVEDRQGRQAYTDPIWIETVP